MADPLLYEINTRCWLRDISEAQGKLITLQNVPESEFEHWRHFGFTHIWAMGVWTSGPRARSAALSHPDQLRVYDEVLPGWKDQDIGASPYAISAYKVPEELGGDAGLKQFKEQLHRYELKLILDFVPNHLGLDHPWLDRHSEYLVQSPKEEPETFLWETKNGRRWFAHGRDPGMPSWTDTVQIDYRVEAARIAMADELRSVAKRCDGVRCDMAMLVLTDVFVRTWQNFPLSQPEPAPTEEFWKASISAVKMIQPGFLFLAEVYWNLEERLQSLGFDYTYDKMLYDRIVAHDSVGVQKHLLGLPPAVVRRCAHFLENHDERRIASYLSPSQERAAALLILGLPGMRFLHEGQLTGAKVRAPVQLLCRPKESANQEISRIYEQFLGVLPQTAIGRGQAELLVPLAAGPDNPTGQDFVLVQWQNGGEAFDLVGVNLASHPSQCRAPLVLPPASVGAWRVTDLLGADAREVADSELRNGGLYLDLPESGAQLLHFEPKRK
jgi:hypothetical protein